MARSPAAADGTARGRGRVVRGGRRVFLLWTATFLAFPPSGLVARELLGPVDGLGPALGGGLINGLGIGAAQWLVLRGRLPDAWSWIPATGIGVAAGLAAGSALVGYETGFADLALQGAVSGLGVGALQALVLRRALAGRALVWIPAASLFWAVGWMATTAAGVDVERQYMVFGAIGALTHSLLSGALIARLFAAGDASTADGA
jgi:hypothetical protein